MINDSILPGGVYPTMVTPFTGDLRVDYEALPPLLRWYEAHGAAGVFAICASSEIAHLSFEERLQILHVLMRAKQPGTLILASGHVESDPAAYLREAQAFAAEGVDAYVFITSLVAARDEGEDTFLRRLENAARALGDTPLGLYECPGPYKRPLPPETIRRLPDIGHFVFLKDTSCDIAKIKAKLAAADGTPLQLYNANTATLLESLRAGCAGYCGVMGNYHPQLYAKLCECYEQDPVLAKQLQTFLNTAFQMRQLYPVCAKYHLQLEGVPIGLASRSRGAALFTPEQKREIEQLRELSKAICRGG